MGRRREEYIRFFRKRRRAKKSGCKSAYKCNFYQGVVWYNEKGYKIKLPLIFVLIMKGSFL